MDDLRDRFARLDRVPVPDLWAEIERRSESTVTAGPVIAVRSERPRVPRTQGSRGFAPSFLGRRSLATLVAAIVMTALLGGAIAVGSGLVRLESNVPPPESTTILLGPTPRASSTPPATVSPSVSILPKRQPTWTAARPMNEGRYLASATLMSDGNVLVAGGRGRDGGDLDSADVYDPATGSWAATGRMTGSRDAHTATLLPDGRVLVVGGYRNSEALASAEIYDPSTGSWAATGRMIEARGYHSATLLPDGRVLVAGGRSNSSSTGHALASTEVYDPSDGTWTATGSLIAAHTFHAAILMADGQVLLSGASFKGYGLTDSATAELYDPSTGSWRATGTMITAGAYQMAVLLPSGNVLVTGGAELVQEGCCGTFSGQALASSELYDREAGRWTAAANMNQGRAYGTATVLSDGTVLVVGGESANAGVASGTSSSTSAAGIPTAEFYDPVTDSWTTTVPMSGSRLLHTATRLPDGRVLVAGGASKGQALDTVELYDPGGDP